MIACGIEVSLSDDLSLAIHLEEVSPTSPTAVSA